MSAILNMPINEITNNTLNLELNKILDRTYPTDKIGVLDVRARVNNEIEIDLEMQMLNKDMLIERVLWYWAKLYSSQLKSGDEYSVLKKTLEILIVNDSIPSLKNIVKPCTRWHIHEHEIFSEVLTDKFEIVIIELPKVEKAYNKDKNNLLLQWMMFLLNPESLEVSKIMQENENIKVATKELEEISEDEINQRIAELREKARRDEAAQRMTGWPPVHPKATCSCFTCLSLRFKSFTICSQGNSQRSLHSFLSLFPAKALIDKAKTNATDTIVLFIIQIFTLNILYLSIQSCNFNCVSVYMTPVLPESLIGLLF